MTLDSRCGGGAAAAYRTTPAPVTSRAYVAIPAAAVPRPAREAAATVLRHCVSILRLTPAPALPWYAATRTGRTPGAFTAPEGWGA